MRFSSQRLFGFLGDRLPRRPDYGRHRASEKVLFGKVRIKRKNEKQRPARLKGLFSPCASRCFLMGWVLLAIHPADTGSALVFRWLSRVRVFTCLYVAHDCALFFPGD
jgi:hypothetical protein